VRQWAGLHQQVLGLEVAVQDAFSVQVGHGAAELVHDAESL
jgi:hypothetical protein